jgi:hypothetical protein
MKILRMFSLQMGVMMISGSINDPTPSGFALVMAGGAFLYWFVQTGRDK